jgi:hypothetical protein
MVEQDPRKISMTSAMLDDRQKMLVINHLWLALRQTFVKMHELNGPQAIFDMQQELISGALNSDTGGFPLRDEKAVIDTTITLFRGLVSFEGQ